MEFQWKAFPTILLFILSGSFRNFKCFSTLLTDVTYEDIKALNATCKGLDSCKLPRRPNAYGHCNCESSCSLLGTCCVDSIYRDPYVLPLKNVDCAFNVYDNKHRYLPMINSCDPEMIYDETAEELCNGSAEQLNDPFLKIPVTDPVTGISYKNYYCFACNINYEGEQPIPWNLKLKIDCKHQSCCVRRQFNRSSIPNLNFDNSKEKWVMDYNDEISMEVYLNASIPEELKHVTPYCYNFPIISECASDWTDDDIEKKCVAYMALARILSSDGFSILYYRNPHCAICNYESIDDMMCLVTEEIYGWKDWKTDILFLNLFSLQDKSTRCEDNKVYDQFSKKCRRTYRAKKHNRIG